MPERSKLSSDAEKGSNKEKTARKKSKADDVREAMSGKLRKAVEQAGEDVHSIIKKWNDAQYEIKSRGDDPNVIILGESHHEQSMIQKQLELIELIKPKYVLHEYAGGFVYDPKIQELKLQSRRLYDNVDKALLESSGLENELRELADKLKFQIIGCDLTTAELDKKLVEQFPQKYVYDDDGLVVSVEDPDLTPSHFSPDAEMLRDAKIVEMISTYEKKSKKPLVVIIGNRHAHNIHDKRLLQKDDKVNYKYVNQDSGIKAESDAAA